MKHCGGNGVVTSKGDDINRSLFKTLCAGEFNQHVAMKLLLGSTDGATCITVSTGCWDRRPSHTMAHTLTAMGETPPSSLSWTCIKLVAVPPDIRFPSILVDPTPFSSTSVPASHCTLVARI